VARVVQLPDVVQRFNLDGAEPVGSTPQQFAVFLKAEMQRWSSVIRDAGIKPEQ
jgi:tripartite-type tricarboxylate transporter receptor subunit TctC